MQALKINVIIFFLFWWTFCNGQGSINVLCIDFSLNTKKYTRGKEFRKVFEGVLANIANPPVIVEREKIADILEKIQEEQNLAKDLSSKQINSLNTANIDYLIYGYFTKVQTSETYDFQFEFVKISGLYSLSKNISSIIRFTEEHLSNSIEFENKVREELNKYSFINGIGLLGSEQNEFIKKQFERDKKISVLENSIANSKKQIDSINIFKATLPDFDARMILQNDLFIVQIKPLSAVPFKYRYSITNDMNIYILGGPFIERPILYPNKKLDWENVGTYKIAELSHIDITSPFKITFTVQNESIYYQESGNKELMRSLKKQYLFDNNDKTLKELKK